MGLFGVLLGYSQGDVQDHGILQLEELLAETEQYLVGHAMGVDIEVPQFRRALDRSTDRVRTQPRNGEVTRQATGYGALARASKAAYGNQQRSSMWRISSHFFMLNVLITHGADATSRAWRCCAHLVLPASLLVGLQQSNAVK